MNINYVTAVGPSDFAIRSTATVRRSVPCPITGETVAVAGRWAIFSRAGLVAGAWALVSPAAARKHAPELVRLLKLVPDVEGPADHLYAIAPTAGTVPGDRRCPKFDLQFTPREFEVVSAATGRAFSQRGADAEVPALGAALHKLYGTVPDAGPALVSPARRVNDQISALAAAGRVPSETVDQERARLRRERDERRAAAVELLIGRFGPEGAEDVVRAIETLGRVD